MTVVLHEDVYRVLIEGSFEARKEALVRALEEADWPSPAVIATYPSVAIVLCEGAWYRVEYEHDGGSTKVLRRTRFQPDQVSGETLEEAQLRQKAKDLRERREPLSRPWLRFYQEHRKEIRQVLGEKVLREVRSRRTVPLFSFLYEEDGADPVRYARNVRQELDALTLRVDECLTRVRQSIEILPPAALEQSGVAGFRFKLFAEDLVEDLAFQRERCRSGSDLISRAKFHDSLARQLLRYDEASCFTEQMVARLRD